MTTDEAATPPAVGPDGNDFSSIDDSLDDSLDDDDDLDDLDFVDGSGPEVARDVSL